MQRESARVYSLFAAVSVTALVISACAGGLRRVETDDPLKKERPLEVSEEMVEKFEVRASPSPLATAPVPSPTPTPAAVAQKKKKLPKALATPTPAPVVYPTRRPNPEIFWQGERLVYDVTYFGTPAGEFALEVLPHKYVNNRKVYHFQGVAKTSALYSLAYRLNDLVETYVDYEGLFSHRFRLLQDESRQYRDAVELNDHEKKQTFYWNRWRPATGQPGDPRETKEYGEIEAFSQDWLSMIYYLRAQPLQVGNVIKIPVISEGKMSTATFTMVRKESIETLAGEFNTIVVRPDEISTYGVAKKMGDSFLWFTDDARHFFVRAELRVKIGTVYVRVRSIRKGTEPVPEGVSTP